MRTKKEVYDYIKKWNGENTDRLEIKPRKELAFPTRIDAAIAAGLANSRQDYIINATLQRLERDGF